MKPQKRLMQLLEENKTFIITGCCVDKTQYKFKDEYEWFGFSIKHLDYDMQKRLKMRTSHGYSPIQFDLINDIIDSRREYN